MHRRLSRSSTESTHEDIRIHSSTDTESARSTRTQSSQSTTLQRAPSPFTCLDYEVSIVVSAIDNIGPEEKHQDNSGLPSNRLPPLSAKSTMLGGTRGSGDGSSSANPSKKKARSRSRSPANMPIAHNRFHYNCCDKKSPSLDEIKAQSLMNVAKRRKSRMNTSGSSNGGGTSGSSQASITTAVPAIQSPGKQASATPSQKSTVSQPPQPPKTPPQPSITATPATPTTPTIATKAGQEQITAYLESNPEFLENYVISNVDFQTVERWVIRKARDVQKGTGVVARRPSLAKWKFCVHADKRAMLQEMTSHVQDNKNRSSKDQVMYELATCIKGAIDADAFNLYIVSESHEDLYKYMMPNQRHLEEDLPLPQYQSFGAGSTMAAYVAQTKEKLRDSTSNKNPNYPEGVKDTEIDYHVLLMPVKGSSNGGFYGIMEFLRNEDDSPFYDEDEEIVNSYMVWGEVTIHYAEIYGKVERHKDLTSFLLNVVRSIFMEMISMDTLIVKIMNFAQKLVSADRASLFLVDAKTNQLYARIFDIMGTCIKNGESNGNDTRDFTKEIRFPVGTGIAGFVAETGETLNVHDAYKDPRFNATIDEQTGYTTRSILCMPICIRGQVIGVVQMINKIGGTFTSEDEEAFEMFSVYCGLALHHAKLYDKIRRSEQKYKVALEVLSYHNASSANEVDDLVTEGAQDCDEKVASFSFYALNMDDNMKVKKALSMFVDLFGLERFEYDTLVRFFITVRKNYRHVAYHNWTHGFHVANSIYCILKSSPGIFKPLECLSMFVGAICHDLDHRGFNNKFMIDIGSPLAAIYSTSTMEHHHFNMTVIILQQESHNIFSKLNHDEYRQVLGNIKHCILATDLALFFPNKARLSNILKEDAFSWDLPDHRLFVQALAMTGADLSATSKPWDLQMVTVKTIYEEFYNQGDREIIAGRQPVPIMNRIYTDQQALHQVGFIGGICLPCYDLLVQVLPATEPMQGNCKDNLNTWKDKADERRREMAALEVKISEENSKEKKVEDQPAEEEEDCEDDLKMESAKSESETEKSETEKMEESTEENADSDSNKATMEDSSGESPEPESETGGKETMEEEENGNSGNGISSISRENMDDNGDTEEKDSEETENTEE